VQALTFRTIAAIALADSFRELVSPRTGIYLQRFKQAFRYRPVALDK
jgi:hypothetical protein